MFLNKSETRAPSQCLTKMHHDLLLNFSEESLFEGSDRTFNDVYMDLPYPIVKPKYNIKPSEDTVVSLVEKKNVYLDLLKKARVRFKYDSKKIVKKKMDNKDFIYLPERLFDFYREKDPDKHFNCDYNYYYTGGNLGVLEDAGSNFLLYPDLNNEIFLLDLENTENLTNINFKTHSTIHSISTVKNSINNAFVVREKNTTHILELDENKRATVKWKGQHKSPILDAKLNTTSQSHIGIIWSNGNFCVKDTESNRTLIHYKSFENSAEETCDNFQQFDFFRDNQICLMDRYKIKILDYRAKSLVTTFDPEVIKCNSLCNFKILNNSLLLASRHYIMKTDLRYFKSLFTYSHTLDTPPCYMDIALKDEDVYLAVAGHKQNSKVLFTGKSPYSLPYKVPCIVDTLDKMMLWNPELILYLHDFEQRLKHSIAGLQILNLNGDISIFTSNGLGEIFKQSVFEQDADSQQSLEILLNWLKQVEIPQHVQHVNGVADMREFVKLTLNSPPNKDNLEYYNQESKVEEFLAKFEPRYSKKNVKSVWAQKFVSLWQDSEDSDETDDNPMDNLPDVAVVDKVEEWIQAQKLSASTTSREPRFSASTSFEEPKFSASTSIQEPQFSDSSS